MNTTINPILKPLLDGVKRRQEANEPMCCPRCGRNDLVLPMRLNPMLDSVGVFVCDDCFQKEQDLREMNTSFCVYDWACAYDGKPDGDYKERTADDAWMEIKETLLPHILSLYETLSANSHDTWSDAFIGFYFSVVRSCKGVTDIWNAGDGHVHISFETSDGSVLLRLRNKDGNAEYTADHIGAMKSDCVITKDYTTSLE